MWKQSKLTHSKQVLSSQVKKIFVYSKRAVLETVLPWCNGKRKWRSEIWAVVVWRHSVGLCVFCSQNLKTKSFWLCCLFLLFPRFFHLLSHLVNTWHRHFRPIAGKLWNKSLLMSQKKLWNIGITFGTLSSRNVSLILSMRPQTGRSNHQASSTFVAGVVAIRRAGSLPLMSLLAASLRV